MPYNPALDGIRAIAVIVVMAFHARIPGFLGGYFGVYIFFVLSGFLITTLLLEEKETTDHIGLKAFFLRRFWRLTPPLVLMVVAHVVVVSVVHDRSTTLNVRDGLLAVFYLTDYSRIFGPFPAFFNHTWSLSVEAHFYLLWPFLLLAVLQLPRRTQQLAVLGFVWTLSAAWRWYEISSGTPWDAYYYRFDPRLSGLCLGGLVACLARSRSASTHPRVADGIGLLAMTVVVFSTMEWKWKTESGAFTWGASIVELAAAGLILTATCRGSWTKRLLSLSPVAYVGKLSYGLYLWHYPTMYLLRKELPWLETFAAGTSVAFAMSVISYHTFEQWLASWRKRQRHAGPVFTAVGNSRPA